MWEYECGIPNAMDLKSHPEKCLTTHLLNVSNIAQSMNTFKIDKQVLEYTTKLHDFGKATTYFQRKLGFDNNKKQELNKRGEFHHSKFSALVALWAYLNNKDINPLSKNFTFQSNEGYNAMIIYMAIYRHHGSLIKPEMDLDDEDIAVLIRQIESILPNVVTEIGNILSIPLSYNKILDYIKNIHIVSRKFTNYINKLSRNNSVESFITMNLLYSLLINSDKLDSGISYENLTNRTFYNNENIIDKYMELMHWDTPDTPVNTLRTMIYHNVIDIIQTINKAGIYLLNVPTGLGKTLTVFSAAMKLRYKIYKEQDYTPRIIYALPFINIIEQNYDVIAKAGVPADSNILLKHHYMSDIYYNKYNKNSNQARLMIEGWESEIIVTTFMQLFHSLIGYNNKMMKKFNKIPGSIIILDEVQAIPLRYWKVINEILRYLVEHYNTYIIMMTASAPSMLGIDQSLVEKPEFYFSQVSRCRIKYMRDINIAKLSDMIITELRHNKSVLTVLNTIKSSIDVFNALPKLPGIEYIYLSTNITPIERLERIQQIKKPGLKVVVSTQIIEAGVDIDLDTVFRDIAPFDSILQTAGRCNRNFNKTDGTVYVFHLDNGKYARYIYDNILLNETIKILEQYIEFPESMFWELSNTYFNRLNMLLTQDNSILKAVYSLNYSEGEDSIQSFKLIINDYPRIDIFIELDDVATRVLQQYKDIQDLKDPLLQKIEYNKIKNIFSSYIISIGQNRVKQLQMLFDDIMYISKNDLETCYNYLGYSVDL